MEVKLLLPVFRQPVVTMGHSLLFAVSAWAAASWGQEGEASQSVTRPAERKLRGSRLSTRSPRPSSPRDDDVPPDWGGNWIAPSLCRGPSVWLFAPAEFGAVTPHAVQDDGQLASDGDLGAGHAAALGDLHAPGAQRRPFAATLEQGVGRLVKSGSGQFVAAPADSSLDTPGPTSATAWASQPAPLRHWPTSSEGEALRRAPDRATGY